MNASPASPAFKTRRRRPVTDEGPMFQLPEASVMMKALICMKDDETLMVSFYPYLLQAAETWQTETSVLELIEKAALRFGLGSEQFAQPARRFITRIIRILVPDDTIYESVLKRWKEWNHSRET